MLMRNQRLVLLVFVQAPLQRCGDAPQIFAVVETLPSSQSLPSFLAAVAGLANLRAAVQYLIVLRVVEV